MLQFNRNTECGTQGVKFTAGKILMVIVYALLLQVVVVVLIGAILGSNSTFMETPAGKLVTNFITAITVIIATGVVYQTKDIVPALFKRKFNSKVIFSGIKWGLLAFLLSWLTNWLSYTVYQQLAWEIQPQQATLILDNLPDSLFIPAIILVGFLAPIFEELVFRGLLQKTVAHYTTPLLAVAISGLLFALSHFDFYQIPGLLVLGLILSISYYRTKTLYTPIIAHVINNLVFIVCYLLL